MPSLASGQWRHLSSQTTWCPVSSVLILIWSYTFRTTPFQAGASLSGQGGMQCTADPAVPVDSWLLLLPGYWFPGWRHLILPDLQRQAETVLWMQRNPSRAYEMRQGVVAGCKTLDTELEMERKKDLNPASVPKHAVLVTTWLSLASA